MIGTNINQHHQTFFQSVPKAKMREYFLVYLETPDLSNNCYIDGGSHIIQYYLTSATGWFSPSLLSSS